VSAIAVDEDVQAAVDVSGLSVHAGPVTLLHEVSFSIGAGERVGLIGESGCGKSLTALSVMGLLAEGLDASGSVRLGGREVIGLPERAHAALRGTAAAMVFQEPMSALNPLMRVGAQVAEAITLHSSIGDDAAEARAIELLAHVELPDPAVTARAYPFQLSGGQRQRVMLAIALATDPRLLICDEPTTALDVTVQARMLALIDRLVDEQGAALLFITHDLAVMASLCDRVIVMYGGRVVEDGETAEVLGRPRHPYTAGLVAASAATATTAPGGRLPTIAGSVPPAGHFPSGCVFRNRCPRADEACELVPALVELSPGHEAACVHPVEVSA
jgi:oligopeptide/dipeptide ABC transporter ATP-binding protein